MLWTNWNECYDDNIPLGVNLDELIWEEVWDTDIY